MAGYQAKQEFQQSIARFAVCVIALIFHIFLALFTELSLRNNFLAISSYGVMSFAWLLWVKATPGRYSSRINLPIPTDMGINCLMMGTLGDHGVYFYPLFLWMIVGYGMRFGTKFLYRAWVFALVLFASILVITPYWQAQLNLGIALFLGLVILPFFFVGLLGKLHELNQRLTVGLRDREKRLRDTANELIFLKEVNQSSNLVSVASAVLDRARNLCDGVERARFLIRDVHDQKFYFIALDGYEAEQFETPLHKPAVIESILRETGTERSPGLYLLKGRGCGLFFKEFADIPKAVLTISIYGPEELLGLVLFDNHHFESAFEKTDYQQFESFKHHLSSALNRAWLLQALQERNERLSVRQKQLVRQEKMASLGKVTAGLAHEFQNPLNFITNFAQLSRNHCVDIQGFLDGRCCCADDQIKVSFKDLHTNLTIISTHGEKLSKLVRTMQNLAVDGEYVDGIVVIDLILECFNLVFQQQDREHFGILDHLDPEVDKVQFSGRMLSRALIHILKNAREAMEERRSGDAEFQGLLKLSSRLCRNRVVISIEDNGGGVAPYEEQAIFDPFFTTKPPGSGHIGLGLTIGYETVVSQFRGELVLINKVGVGACFQLSLPILEENPQDSSSL